ncbi:hypothetical protein Pmani_002859 [Petrolisthes manimaculis]|uniref:Uncharacterized protein n=1 Tax=Petrolisthes manimaculis TaxID=1843537 RepID=A0AAE1QK26_9EUCA|nr:hypothetical protein Pmani_002859 [Petrolisthes manimaculis]
MVVYLVGSVGLPLVGELLVLSLLLLLFSDVTVSCSPCSSSLSHLLLHTLPPVCPLSVTSYMSLSLSVTSYMPLSLYVTSYMSLSLSVTSYMSLSLYVTSYIPFCPMSLPVTSLDPHSPSQDQANIILLPIPF